jgi:hypothetical protein
MTELIWEGKYDKDGKKNGPVRIALPFQTIESSSAKNLVDPRLDLHQS